MFNIDDSINICTCWQSTVGGRACLHSFGILLLSMHKKKAWTCEPIAPFCMRPHNHLNVVSSVFHFLLHTTLSFKQLLGGLYKTKTDYILNRTTVHQSVFKFCQIRERCVRSSKVARSRIRETVTVCILCTAGRYFIFGGVLVEFPCVFLTIGTAESTFIDQDFF
jgi:hypothetical protein